jgi:hypothetical protein
MVIMKKTFFQYEDVLVTDNYFRNGNEEYDLKEYEFCLVEKGSNLTSSEFFWWRIVMICYGFFALLFLVVVAAEKFLVFQQLKTYLFLFAYGYGGYFYYTKKKNIYILFLVQKNRKLEVLRSEQEIFAKEVEQAVNHAFHEKKHSILVAENNMPSNKKQLEQQKSKRESNFCSNCGERLQSSSKFCSNCGEAIYLT